MEKVQALARKLATRGPPRAHHRGDRHGQDLYRPGHPPLRAPGPASPSWSSTAPPCRATSSRASCSATSKGAFTGAMARKAGKVEACAGGTLFLDEIGDLPLELQGKLLRFVQEGKLRAAGRQRDRARGRAHRGRHPLRPGRAGQGREVPRRTSSTACMSFPWPCPPCAIAPGTSPCWRGISSASISAQAAWTFSPDALEAIRAHAWPGNVRELENKLQRAWLFHSGGVITAADLGLEAASPAGTAGPAGPGPPHPRTARFPGPWRRPARNTRARCCGNASGISRATSPNAPSTSGFRATPARACCANTSWSRTTARTDAPAPKHPRPGRGGGVRASWPPAATIGRT